MYKRIEITTEQQPKDGRRRPRSVAMLARMRPTMYTKGRKVPPDELTRRIASQTGLKRNWKFRAKMSEINKGRRLPLAAIAASVAIRKGKKLSNVHCAKLRAAWAKRKAIKAAFWRPIFGACLEK